MLKLQYMQEVIHPASAPRGRPRRNSFALPQSDNLTANDTLINVQHDDKQIRFVFKAGADEIVLTYKPFRGDFAPLLDAVKGEALRVGSLTFPVRGAVREAFHASVVSAHYRSI